MPEVISSVDRTTGKDLFKITRPRCTRRRCASTTWTVSEFNSTFIKAIVKLHSQEKIGAGLSFYGLRHTLDTLLVAAGVELNIVRRWLGQKTLAMAILYSETATASKKMHGAMNKLDPLGSKARTKVPNRSK
jgi:integrase